MAQNETVFALEGGMDLVTPGIAKREGTVLAALNYEPVNGGYKRVQGFERFDGRPRPSEGADATEAASRRAAIGAVPGQGPVRGVGYFNGQVVAFRDKSDGATAGMYKSTSTGWSAVTLPNEVVTAPDPVVADKYWWMMIRHTSTFTLAFGNTLVGQSSGATGKITAIIAAPHQTTLLATGEVVWQATVGIPLDGIAGTFAVGETLKVSTTTKGKVHGTYLANGSIPPASTPAPPSTSPITLAPGGRYEFITHNFYGAASLKRLYGVSGVNSAFSWDGTNYAPIPTNMPIDKPHKLAVHKQALVLGFPGGSTQISAVGNAENWDAVLGAVEIGIGDEITDYISTTGTLVILGRNGISLLYGNDESDFQLEPLSSEAGALPYTAELMGQPLYMDNRGVRSLSTTQAFGNFSIGTHSAIIQPLLDALKEAGVVPVASCRVRSKDQYRLFFSNGFGLTFHLTGRGYSILPFNLGKVVSCICSVENEYGEEEIYFGATDGFVYQLDKGVDFDGGAVSYFLRLAYTHAGGPNLNKRWHRILVDYESDGEATLQISADFDYGSSDIRPVGDETLLFGGGVWDESSWDEFEWDTPIEGQAECYVDGFGENMSILFAGEASGEAPHLLKSVTAFWTPRGQRR